jgi:glycosyltransferase involved in cell wall biosynthesis
MKICFFGDTAAHHLRRWARYFVNREHEVHIITFNPDLLGGYSKIKVHIVRKQISNPSLLGRILNLIPMMLVIKELLKKINPDIIHVHSVSGYAYMGMLIGFHPLVITPWGSDVLIEAQKSKIERFFIRLALKKADLITCDGENTKEAMKNLGILSQKIKFITFGVDIQKFKSGSGGNHIREKHSLQNSKIVISIRTLNPVHNVETFIKSIPLVLKHRPDTKFIIVGHGSEQEYLINLSKSLNIYNSIKFFGKVEEDEIVACLQASDIYVSTSLSESGLAGSTAEAMACELPVINTDTGDIKLWIKDGEGGFIVPTKNPGILAEKIIYLLKNDEERIKIGKINRKVIGERNNYYKEMDKMGKIYKGLINK